MSYCRISEVSHDGICLNWTDFYWGNSPLQNNKIFYYVTKRHNKADLQKSSLWHLGMCLLPKTLWCSFPCKCLRSWAKSGASFLYDLNHPLKGASSTPLTILNALWCRLFRCLNTFFHHISSLAPPSQLGVCLDCSWILL